MCFAPCGNPRFFIETQKIANIYFIYSRLGVAVAQEVELTTNWKVDGSFPRLTDGEVSLGKIQIQI